MNRFLLLVVLSSLFVCAADQAQDRARVVFVMADEKNSPVTDVSQDQVAVELSGSSLHDFSIAALKSQPLQICLMFDSSGSSEGERQAIDRFFKGSEALLRITIRPKIDSACLVDFFTKASVDQDWTDDVDALVKSVQKHFAPKGGTALYDSLAETCQHFDNSSASAPRRAVLLASDGEDNVSSKHVSDAITQCQSRNIMVFTFDVSARPDFSSCGVITSPGCARSTGIACLKEIAEKTGGTYFAPVDDDATVTAYKVVLDRLAAMQEINFERPSRKSKLTLRANRPKWSVLPKQAQIEAQPTRGH